LILKFVFFFLLVRGKI